MYINVDIEAGETELLDAHDCGAFSLLVAGGSSAERLDEVLREDELGTVDPEGAHAWIELDAIRAMAMGKVDDAWPADFSSMVDHAREKGWLDESGNSVRGHIDWVDGPARATTL